MNDVRFIKLQLATQLLAAGEWFAEPVAAVPQIQTVRIGIQFHGNLVLGRCSNHGVHVEFIGIASQQHPPRRMADE